MGCEVLKWVIGKWKMPKRNSRPDRTVETSDRENVPLSVLIGSSCPKFSREFRIRPRNKSALLARSPRANRSKYIQIHLAKPTIKKQSTKSAERWNELRPVWRKTSDLGVVVFARVASYAAKKLQASKWTALFLVRTRIKKCLWKSKGKCEGADAKVNFLERWMGTRATKEPDNYSAIHTARVYLFTC